jgi:tRNA (mo5U34)-methyltransferase
MTVAMGKLRQEVERLRWYHTIDLGDGVVTPGFNDSPSYLARLGFPADLSGRSVLDIGAWDGFYSFEAERRGASRVLATDSFVWHGKTWGSKEGFLLARRALGSRVEDQEIEVLDLSPERLGGVFDVVLFLGVLYHMRHPLLALERVASVTAPGGLVIIETHLDLLWQRRPAIAFYGGREYYEDDTNWCGPNRAAVVAMLRAAGFSQVREQPRPPPLRRLAQRARERYARRPEGGNEPGRGRPRTPVLRALQQDRRVFHAQH